MRKLIHVRGDVWGMFLFFFLVFLGLWQILVAWKRLNGFSLTGYPDRRAMSVTLGVVLVLGSGALYFSRPGHFAAPDVEGIETLALLAFALVTATLVQGALASVVFRGRRAPVDIKTGAGLAALEASGQELDLDVSGQAVPAVHMPAESPTLAKKPVLVLHDYGGGMRDTAELAALLAGSGHHVLSLDLDGHGSNPRGISSPLMEDLVSNAVALLRELTGRETVAVVGFGLGGTVAMELAHRDVSVTKAIALDPPSREQGRRHTMNAARELKPDRLLKAFFRPPARRAGGRRVSLSLLIDRIPGEKHLPATRVTILGTEEAWLNSPEALRTYTHRLALRNPTLIDSRHGTLTSSGEVLESVLNLLE